MMSLLSATRHMVFQSTARVDKLQQDRESQEVSGIVAVLRDLGQRMDEFSGRRAARFASRNKEDHSTVTADNFYQILSLAQVRLNKALGKTKKGKLYLKQPFIQETTTLLQKCENNLQGLSLDDNWKDQWGDMIVEEYEKFHNSLDIFDQIDFRGKFLTADKGGRVSNFFILIDQTNNLGLHKKQFVMDEFFMGHYHLNNYSNKDKKNEARNKSANYPSQLTPTYYRSSFTPYFYPNLFPENNTAK